MTEYGYAVHPAADVFPLLSDGELAELADDIRRNGLIEPVWLFDEPERGIVLLDGRNRIIASRMAGVEPRTQVYSGADPIGFSISQNVKRRHLSASQLAFIALETAKLLETDAARDISAKRSAVSCARWEQKRRAKDVLSAAQQRTPVRLTHKRDEVDDSPPTVGEKQAQDTLERLRKKVYFIRAGDRVKVGVSWNPDQRLDDLRKHNPDAELLGSVDGAFDVERAFHRKLEEHALGNEWFRWCDEVSWVIVSAIQMSTSGHLDPTEVDTLGSAALTTGVSRAYVALAKKITRDAPDLVNRIRQGDMDLRRAERVIRDRQAEKCRVEQARSEAAAQSVSASVDIRHGDFRDVLADLQDVDAIITDPPYPAEYLPLLGDLAAWADKVLTPDGVMAVLIGQTHLPEVYRLLDGHRPYRWTGCYLTAGGGYVSHPRKVQSNWKPLIVYGGGPRFADVIRSEGTDAGAKSLHRWGQDYAAFHTLIERLTQRGQTVVDPFMGSGTTLLAAHALGRHAIGADIDAVAVATTRERVA